MRFSVAPAFLLLASASAQVMTIQTSTPLSVGTSSSQCMEVCVTDPCFPCSTSSGLTTHVPVPTLTDTVVTGSSGATSVTDTGIMSIPPGETPISTGNGTGTPEMTTPKGTTPTNTGSSAPSTTSSTGGSGSSGSTSHSSTASASTSKTTGAAPSGLKGDGSSFLVAMALSGLSITFGFAWTLI